MKKLILVGMFLFSSLAMAATVERILPADAHNVRVASAVVDTVVIGSRFLFDSGDGPVSEAIYGKRLVVTVKYDSKDLRDVNQTVYEDGPELDRTPTITYFFELPAVKLAAIEARSISAVSLVAPSLVVASVTIDDPNYQYQCRYDGEYNTKVDPKCEEHPNKVTQVRPVLKLNIAAN
jgi:hypothetical protein